MSNKRNKEDNSNNNRINKKRVRGFDSIRTKLTLITVMIIVFVVCLTWLANRTFIERYYQKSKLENLVQAYDDINSIFSELSDSEELSDEQQKEIERISSVKNVRIYVFTFNSLYSQKNKVGIDFEFPVNVSNIENVQVFDEIGKYVDGIKVHDKSNISELETSSSHNIYKVYNERIKSYNLEMVGELSSGQNIFISTNYESIKESADIANNFLAIVGIGAVLIGTAVMMFVSRSFSKPILELADIADKMAALDFDAKYDVNSNDEIGRLGQNINLLSSKLKDTIGELKTANNSLQLDIEHKTQIDEMRKEFLSNVSHELKTPIALIQGYAEGLVENISDDVESRNFYCEVIIDEAAKMNNMVKKLLNLNHIEFGDNKVDYQRFDITELISGVINSTGILAEQKQATVCFEEPHVSVWADEYMIEEVVTNYLSNAFNHIDGERKVEISYEDKGDVLRVNVFNTGNQIPEDELDKIWIKFYKVDKARTREYGGSGVGLSIVKAIMNSHNRMCGAVNRENGVEFWFEIDKN